MNINTKIISLVVLFFAINLTGLSQWQRITTIPAPFDNNYWLEVYFLKDDPNYGWVCGFNGRVIRTTDGGKTWNGVTIPNTYQLESVYFPSKNIGYVSGPNVIYKSTDGGANWFDVTPKLVTTIWGNFFLTDNYGMVIGGGCDLQSDQGFYVTTDGGTSWHTFTRSDPNAALTDVILDSTGVGYAAGSSEILKTTDGGYTWNLLCKSSFNSYDWQEDLHKSGNSFLVPYSGSCTGNLNYGGMRFSTNGGLSWQDTMTQYCMFGSFLIDSLRGWVCGQGPSVYYTSNGGVNWKLVNCGITDNDSLDDIWFINDTTGWVVGTGVFKYKKIDTLTPYILPDSTTRLCAGDSVTLYSNAEYYQYSWSSGETTRSITVKKTGTYYLSVINDQCDWTKSNSVKVIVNPIPSISILSKNSTTICQGDSVILYTKPKFESYNWSDGETSDSIIVKSSGSYTISVIDSNGCTNKSNISILVNPVPNPKILVNGELKFCLGDTTYLQADKDYAQYQWVDALTNKVVNSTSKEYDATTTGIYYLNVVDENGCKGTSDSVAITVRNDSNRISITNISADDKFYLDSVHLTLHTCKKITVFNYSEEDYTINQPYLYINKDFSIPQTQLPIFIPAKDSVSFLICFSPSKTGFEHDTLLLLDVCSQHLVYLESAGIENYYIGNSQCNDTVVISVNKYDKYTFLTALPSPNPTDNNLQISFEKFTPRNESYLEKCELYNSIGEKVCSANINNNTYQDDSNGSYIYGNFSFNTLNIPQGLYFVVINTPFWTKSYSVIIRR